MASLDNARPRPRAFWSDTRFLLGIVLIVASIAGVWGVVAAARHTVPVLAAARTIVPGSVVSADDVQVVDVALGRAADTYLAADGLTGGAVATRTIAPGELVPKSAVGSVEGVRTTTVVLRSTGELPTAVTAGAAVEVWAAAQIERGRFETPRVLVSRATVKSVARDDSVMGASGASLELVIDRSDVAAALAAIADGSSLSIVPLPGASR
jgi:formylmethanofuran:tetrahydromethanopterin formyltransferase